MSFIADKQTTEDINLLGKFKPHSIYGLFNKVKTPGGERLLDAMFQHPLTNVAAINKRSRIFEYFQGRKLKFPVAPDVFRKAEEYLSAGTSPNFLQSGFSVYRLRLMGTFLKDERYAALLSGLKAAIIVLTSLKEFLAPLISDKVNPWHEKAEEAGGILNNGKLDGVKLSGTKEMTVWEVIKSDHLLRHQFRKEMELLMEAVYELDVYISVSAVASERNLHYAYALPSENSVLRASAIWHPALEKAIPNPVSLHSENNVLFLTGANMAGKSTFMKSLGTAVYLAHMGFPVAAKGMEFSVRDGLYSSINVADNLNLGYSHFYAEVLRVKNAAEEVSHGKNMVVIFDELFKGTNVKDAYDATLSVTAAFSKYRNCLFVISTHIIEVGEALRSSPNLQFAYMPTIMKGNVPEYPYTLMEGITSDRHGMMIVMNEGILEMIRGTKNKKIIF